MRRSAALLLILLMLFVSASAVPNRDAAAQRGEGPSSAGKEDEGGRQDATTTKQAGKSAARGRSPSAKSNFGKADAASSASAKATNRQKRPPGITPGREAAVMTFVQENHPDLEALLVYLKRNRPADYAKAIRELFNVSERLARVQEQDENRYELELAQWKLQSRIRLLVARLRMEQSDELRRQLREALSQQVEVQIKILQGQRDRLADRLERLDAKLERLGENRQEEVEAQFKSLTSAAARKTAPVSKKSASTDAQGDVKVKRNARPK